MGLGLILVAALLQPQLGVFPGLSALLPVAGASLILLHSSQGFFQRMLSSRIMVWVGELSYSLYLWHWPVLALLRYYSEEPVLDMQFTLLFIT
ncbi:MAG: acyltransferase, partial [Comamonas sp.]|nr:acyltransferase [Comamonas sp.]